MKYDETLLPFLALMRKELHANSGKGDRPGWLAMTRQTAMLEIWHHCAKLQKAALNDESDLIREHAADVANMAMMLADVCKVLHGDDGELPWLYPAMVWKAGYDAAQRDARVVTTTPNPYTT